MANDYAAMQARLADELSRSDLTSQIKLAILSAIQTYRGKRFYFNELRSDTFNTVSGQEFYTSADLADIPNLPDIDSILFNQSSSFRYPLVKRTWAQLELWSINPTTVSGFPTDFCWYGGQIRLYPIPNGVYSCRISGTIRLTPDPLSADNDTNAWMTDGEELIRQRAKADLNINVIRDPEWQAERRNIAAQGLWFLSSMEQSAFDVLAAESTERLSSGHLVATAF